MQPGFTRFYMNDREGNYPVLSSLIPMPRRLKLTMDDVARTAQLPKHHDPGGRASAAIINQQIVLVVMP